MRKVLFLIFFIINFNCVAQDSTRKCPKGQTYFPELSTSSLTIQGGCWPDSIIPKLWRAFSKNMCGEMGSASFSDNLQSIYSSDWDDQKDSCITKQIYRKAVFNNWGEKIFVDISHQEYSQICKCEFQIVDGKSIPLWQDTVPINKPKPIKKIKQ